MSLILRHKPETVGINLDENGWCGIINLVVGINTHSDMRATNEDIEKIVKEDKKGRYSIKDGKIRANQGHSVKVDLELKPITPPAILYHGTPIKNIDVINRDGLKKMNRHAVHLSGDYETAQIVGSRGNNEWYLYEIDTTKMIEAGYKFYKSENGVYLTEVVPPEFLGN